MPATPRSPQPTFGPLRQHLRLSLACALIPAALAGCGGNVVSSTGSGSGIKTPFRWR